MSEAAVRTLVAVDGAVDQAVVERALGDPRVAVAALGDPAAGWPARADAEALLVVCRDHSETGLALVRRAQVDHPGRPVVVACDGTPNGFLRKAFLAGAEDVVEITSAPQAAGDTYLALAKAVARRATDAAATAEGRIVTVLGPKGGTGKTLVSTNLAAALAGQGRRAVLVDLDLQFGDVGLALGLRPERTFFDLAQSGGRPDATKLEGFLVEHRSGVAALLAPTRPDQAPAITPAYTREVLQALRGATPFVIVNTPPAFTPEVIAALTSPRTSASSRRSTPRR